ncbi:MAG: hypothetical protein ACI4W7_07570 [Candidatus Spyradenecus sp.]
MTRFALSFLALALLLSAGCLGPRETPSLPRYTVADPPATPAARNLRPAVRLAADLRSAPGPLHFHADGTVTPVQGLAYYAPLELAIEAALRDATAYDPGLAPRRPAITVLAFGRDDRAATPRAVVRLATSAPDGSPREAAAARDLPPYPSPRDLRAALAAALLEAYTELAQ